MGVMRYLVDTHVLLWWLFDDPELPDGVREILADPADEILVSAASAWEIATKHRVGKLDAAAELVKDIPAWIDRAGFTELSVTVSHAQRAAGFGHAHRDPFDRVLAAQSEIEGVPLVTSDRVLATFGIPVVWT
ncbi:MAG: type II toxin-antitoxin system VapC family toxin [Polyangia bacterium]